jgi:hypothetical protein
MRSALLLMTHRAHRFVANTSRHFVLAGSGTLRPRLLNFRDKYACQLPQINIFEL